MKSYFSQLANQSALRYRQANKASSASSTEKSAGEFAPLHREETIFTETVSSKIDAPQKVRNESSSLETAFPETPSPVSKTESSSKIDAKPAENVSIELFKEESIGNAKNSSLPNAKNSDAARIIYQAERIQNEVSNENKLSEPASSVRADSDFGEQTIVKENEAARTIKQTNTPQTQRIFQSVQSESELAEISFQSVQNEFQPIEAEPADDAPNQPEYFKKTAASLKAGTTDKSEIQQILMQEIYEWTSGAPVSPARLPEEENDSKELSKVRVVAAQPSETISFFEQKETVQNPAQNPLKEQNLELSIGNISIIVEESPTVQNTTVQNTVSDKTTTAAPRGSSRLNRYYL